MPGIYQIAQNKNGAKVLIKPGGEIPEGYSVEGCPQDHAEAINKASGAIPNGAPQEKVQDEASKTAAEKIEAEKADAPKDPSKNPDAAE